VRIHEPLKQKSKPFDLNVEFRKGITKALLYYCIAFALTALTYIASGREYIHGPGFTHIVGFLFIVAGAIWLISNVVSLYITPHNKAILGSLLMHLLVVGCFVVYIGWILFQINNPGKKIQPESEYLGISNTGDTIVVATEKGDTTYFQIRDSVYKNHYKRDSLVETNQ
jgi:hypothetical protein